MHQRNYTAYSKEQVKEITKSNKKIQQEKINQVKAVLPEEEFSKMKKDDILLYHANFLDRTNRFRNVVKLSSIATIEWINHLCKSNELYQMFMDEYYQYGKVQFFMALCRFRDYLKSIQKFDDESLHYAITYNSWDVAHRYLQELFLDVISIGEMNYIADVIVELGLTAEDLIEMSNDNRRIIREIESIKSKRKSLHVEMKTDTKENTKFDLQTI